MPYDTSIAELAAVSRLTLNQHGFSVDAESVMMQKKMKGRPGNPRHPLINVY